MIIDKISVGHKLIIIEKYNVWSSIENEYLEVEVVCELKNMFKALWV